MSSRTICAYVSAVPRSLCRAPRFSGSAVLTGLRTAGFPPSSPRFRHLHTGTRAASIQAASRVPVRTYSSGAGDAVQTLPDPDRADLFYHLFPAPTSISASAPVFALSYLPDSPPSVLSCAVIGWLPAAGAGDEAGLNDFVENGASL